MKRRAGEIFSYLHRNRGGADDIPDLPQSGIYAVFAKEPNCLPGIVLPSNGLIYIGQSGNLKERNHFKADNSGFSTLRRSIGTILKKKELRLTAVHRGNQPSNKNCECYCFANQGEQRLTQWFWQNLDYSICPFDGDTVELETEIIRNEKPPLNLIKWLKGHPNPQKPKIQRLRNICKNEAKRKYGVNSTIRSNLQLVR